MDYGPVIQYATVFINLLNGIPCPKRTFCAGFAGDLGKEWRPPWEREPTKKIQSDFML
jgi:hypothetical protein